MCRKWVSPAGTAKYTGFIRFRTAFSPLFCLLIRQIRRTFHRLRAQWQDDDRLDRLRPRRDHFNPVEDDQAPRRVRYAEPVFGLLALISRDDEFDGRQILQPHPDERHYGNACCQTRKDEAPVDSCHWSSRQPPIPDRGIRRPASAILRRVPSRLGGRLGDQPVSGWHRSKSGDSSLHMRGARSRGTQCSGSGCPPR